MNGDTEHKEYGPYTLSQATLLSIPNVDAKGNVDFFSAPPQEARALSNGDGTLKRKRLSDTFITGPAKRPRIAGPGPPGPPGPPGSPGSSGSSGSSGSPGPPGVPPTAYNSVCVMDVGQGNCNLLIDSQLRPEHYFDVGYPLWFYRNTAPANLAAGAAAPSGPIAAAGMGVVLSHWDWDHWRLGALWPALQALPWVAPVQPVGGASLNFFNNVLGANCTIVPPLWPNTTVVTPDLTLYRTAPPPLAHPAMVINNTGLALSINTQIPWGAGVPHRVVLTGDANFSSLPAPFPGAPNVLGITAVHHGSNAHGAANNLPAPAVANGGRIAYSCGLTPAGYRPYGFPNPVAVGLYRAGQWMAPHEMDTPEGPNIRGGPPLNRGNIRIGGQAAFVPPYANTAFANFPHPLL